MAALAPIPDAALRGRSSAAVAHPASTCLGSVCGGKLTTVMPLGHRRPVPVGSAATRPHLRTRLHALAVERGRAFSEEADTPRSLAEAAWASSVGLCAAGHYDAAAWLADRGADALVKSYGDKLTPTAMGTLGALQLEAAAAHGLAGSEGNAYRYLDAAAATATRMPREAWHLPSAFDRSSVEIMAVIVGVSLRRNNESITRAQRIDLSDTRSVVRRSRLLLECAHAQANRREFDGAVRSLSAAVQTSAEAVALIPWARTLADELTERAPRASRTAAEQVASTLKAVR